MLTQTQRDNLEQAIATYETHLHMVLPYLESRGITENVANRYRLGYVAEATPGLGDDDVVGRLAIPYLTPSGPVDIRFRASIDGATPKYLSRPGSEVRMYNVLAFTRASRNIAITEGEIDAMVCDGIAGIPAVGVPGAANWKAHYPLLFEAYQKVFVLTDGDDAGRDFGRKVAGSMENVIVTPMPTGLDVNEFVLQEGPEALRRKVGIGE